MYCFDQIALCCAVTAAWRNLCKQMRKIDSVRERQTARITLTFTSDAFTVSVLILTAQAADEAKLAAELHRREIVLEN